MDPARRSTETWRSHILRQLKHRDLSQTSMFQDLIRFYTQLLEKTSLTKAVLSSSNRRDCADSSSSLSSLQEQTSWMKKSTGELAYQVVELQQKIQIKTCFLQDQQDSLQVEKRRLGGVSDACQTLQKQVDHFNLENRKLKEDYDSLLERQRWAESKLREQKVQEEEMLEKMLQLKNQAAARMNNRNERRSRARQATLQKDLQTAARSKVTIDSSSSAPSSRSTSPKPELHVSRGRGQTRLFRKRRGHSVSSLKEDLLYPVGFCVSARVPARSLQVLEAHEQGINAVRFSFSSDLLATGGTDRIVKLWELRAGSLTHRTTLDGSTEGITCIEFDPMGQKVLAASYDRSALLWRVDDSVPKVALTGHSRKVTAAKFTRVSNQVVTGSLDRTVRLWDLQRTACVQQVEVVSSCSDLVCSENIIISGHFDCKIRVWDSRLASCTQELPAQGRVTSLDLSSDRRQLLICCRDDCLQLVDLRRWSNERLCFRAEGFKCGSDSTRAVMSPDGCYLAAGSADGAVYIWNVSTGTLETRLPDKHSSSISAVSWSPSGEYVVSVDRSRRAILWSDI
ncbi:protein Atg16l2 isoform X2 [Nothobranchius furzeri]|uniref:Autophagy related 16 like 2 n=1 Tax=Nothobranchius furzeri TaxID=105023 RepID=A0A8C6KJV7_NOTFU|nr:protein Atg16l2 isoform X2 [Nothobranchius furzeri]